MQKFFVENNQIENKQIIIIGEDVKHISNVLRMQKNDELQICNKTTCENYLVKIIEFQKDKVITEIIEKVDSNIESNVQIDLYQGLPKADKMELIIQKTVEIGVNKIIPVDMLRCVVKLEDKEVKKKIERWQKISEGAAKQSKRDIIPQIEDKIKLNTVIQRIKDYDKFFVAYEDEEKCKLKYELKKINENEKIKIGILIGPEGGLDSNEIEKLKQNGAKIVSLGKRILRTETAPIVMISNIIYELEK